MTYNNCGSITISAFFFLLLQLKLFAMKRTIFPVIDNNYDPKAYNAKKIKDYHSNNTVASGLLFASQFLLPLFALPWAILLVTYCIYMRSPYKQFLWEGKFEPDQEQWEMRVHLSIIFTLSLLFSLYLLIMSAVAMTKTKNLNNDNKKWYNSEYIKGTNFHIPTLMLVQDSLVFLIFVIVFSLLCCVALDQNGRSWWKFAAYSIVFPIVNLAIHANYILIGFIHDQQHALGAGIFYAVIILTNMHVLRMAAEVFSR